MRIEGGGLLVRTNQVGRLDLLRCDRQEIKHIFRWGTAAGQELDGRHYPIWPCRRRTGGDFQRERRDLMKESARQKRHSEKQSESYLPPRTAFEG